MRSKIRVLILAAILYKTNLAAQSKTTTYQNNYSLQYGFSLNAFIDIGLKKKTDPAPVFRLTSSAGIGADFLSQNIYPSVNVEVHLYNGGIGSRNEHSFSTLSLDAMIALTLTAGIKSQLLKSKSTDFFNRNVPLYYFSDFTRPALQNPFNSSVSVGTNIIFTPDKGKKRQRIGFLNVHNENFQFSYFNDGGVPISTIYLGDRADRFYTGGFLFSFNFPHNTLLNTISLSYFKYTGYSKSAFEVSNKMYLDYMNYHDSTQQKFNKSIWVVSMQNIQKGLGLNYKWYNNVTVDLQHRIHSALFNAFHMVPYKTYGAIGFNYFYTQNHAGLK